MTSTLSSSNPPAELQDPRSVLRRYGIYPKRSWGQNFLINLALVQRIADEVAGEGIEKAIEIGAGVGTLTAALGARLPQVVAIERDPELVELLKQERAALGDNVKVVDADAMTYDYIEEAAGASTVLAGNLPYQITGKLLRRVVEARGSLRYAIVMMQSEVSDRLRARPGSKTYGVLSVMTQAWFEISQLWRVSPGSFHPQPKVTSSVVRLDPLESPRCGDLSEAELARVVHAGFSARRKTLRNTLSTIFPKAEVLTALEAEGIDSGRRAETLSVEQFAALARRLSVR